MTGYKRRSRQREDHSEMVNLEFIPENVRSSVVFIVTADGRTSVFQPDFTQMTCFLPLLNL